MCLSCHFLRLVSACCPAAGKVIQIGNDYIGLVLLGLYNASIPAKSIRKEFSFDKDAGEWRSSKHPSHVIGVGSHVRFTVDR